MADWLVDCGNTRIKHAFWDGQYLTAPVAIPHHGTLPPKLLTDRVVCAGQVALASVGPESLTAQLITQLQQQGLTVRRVYAQASACGVRNAYPEPTRLGVDRWLALLAARQHYPRASVLVIGAGTALTADLLDAQGQHQGGLLAPGLRLLADSLPQALSHLPPAAPLAPPLALAQTTAAALAQGALACAIGLVERLHVQYGPDQILLHGGDAAMLQAALNLPCQVRPELVLQGLACWLEEMRCVV